MAGRQAITPALTQQMAVGLDWQVCCTMRLVRLKLDAFNKQLRCTNENLHARGNVGFWPSRDNVWTNSSVLAATADRSHGWDLSRTKDRTDHRKMNEPMVCLDWFYRCNTIHFNPTNQRFGAAGPDADTPRSHVRRSLRSC